MEMTFALVCWVGCLLGVSSLHYLWFFSDLLPTVTAKLGKLGILNIESLPEEAVDDFSYWKKEDWDVWIYLRVGKFLGKLLTCPLCGCYHFSLLGGSALALLTRHWEAIPVAWVTYPAVVRKLNMS